MKKKCEGCGKKKKILKFYITNNVCKKCLIKKAQDNHHSIVGKAKSLYSEQCKKSKLRGHKPPKYTFNELFEFLLDNSKYIMLFKSWRESGWLRDKAPSIDRLNNSKGYSFKNIEVVPWSINNQRANDDIKAGKLIRAGKIKSKAVNQYHMDGKLLNTFISANQAQEKTGVINSGIGKCCKFQRNHAGGFIWRYVDG